MAQKYRINNKRVKLVLCHREFAQGLSQRSTVYSGKGRTAMQHLVEVKEKFESGNSLPTWK